MKHHPITLVAKRARTALASLLIAALTLVAAGVQAPTATAQALSNTTPVNGSIVTGRTPIVGATVNSAIDIGTSGIRNRHLSRWRRRQRNPIHHAQRASHHTVCSTT